MNFFEKWLQDAFSLQLLEVSKFVINLAVTAVLSWLVTLFYIRFGHSASNRRKLARSFLPLAMTTMVIIFIVKGSVALSLGLVGALSIVRFRAAIKEPEELVYLFLNIGVGLAAGAGEIDIAVCAVILILTILLVQAMIVGRGKPADSGRMFLNISLPSAGTDVKSVSDLITAQLPYVELRRMDSSGSSLELSYLVEIPAPAHLDALRTALLKISPQTELSVVEQRNIAL